MASFGDNGVSASQEMQNQVETLRLQSPQKKADEEVREITVSSSEGREEDNQEHIRGVTSDGVGFNTSDKWAKFYPNQEVAVVTSIGQPPVPPEGYVPLRHGHSRDAQIPEAALIFEEGVPNGFSVDTLLWNEKLLEQRIMQLTAWTRRSPMPRRQKLDRINCMVNQCNTTNTKTF
ncbi:hypothetical protein GN244_ATG05926 [Phytophthora infestans]|uniref:Uncharacterized protein n=1 Tax=Phytophthora infestans TaxID=4787 RepID=A0A833TEB1_PHYIN|nr:hypothetical protein GN244_ATG05926 [Phytophthora infestans]KAF4144232.1 hypothetical protein GN958_ATG06553 [Phytophthora infestans]